MKNIIIIALFTTLLFSSCSSVIPYYQIYKTDIPSDLDIKNGNLIYEDSNCKIFYNIWKNGGNMDFRFYNKTNRELMVHLDKSFFILNGVAYNYYKNRTYSTSVATSKAKSTTNIYYYKTSATSSAQSTTITIQEEKVLIIPPNTSKLISENYQISNKRFSDCDLVAYPSNKQGSSSISFDRDNSPFVFRNRITYSLDSDSKLNVLEHNFFVNEIINYNYNTMFISKKDIICGEEQSSSKRYFKNYEKNNFYFKYVRTRKKI